MKKKLLAVVLALALVLGLGATAIAANGDVELTVNFRDIVVTRNGEEVELKDEQGNVLEPFLYNGSTYLPIRAISETVGYNVSWDGETKTVSIEVPEEEPEPTTYAIVDLANYGTILGYKTKGVSHFYGIPYGKAERFQQAEPADPWTGYKATMMHGEVSPQLKTTMEVFDAFTYSEEMVENEDTCLNLNVWSANMEGGEKQPVIVWLHGGGMTTGGSIEKTFYAGANMADYGDVVFVSVNHRLNYLGFMDLSKYGEEYAGSGNVGMTDIVLALEWVQENIETFGGDPSNVTIIGQSGGGTKVTTLMSMPSAQGLFHKAVAMSGGSAKTTRTSEQAQAQTDAVLDHLGYPKTAEGAKMLAELEYDDLYAACSAAGVNAGPVWDDEYVLNDFAISTDIPLISTSVFGEFSTNFGGLAMPFIVGNTIDGLMESFLPNITEDEVLAKLTAQYKGDAEAAAAVIAAFKEAYPGHHVGEYLYMNSRNDSLATAMYNLGGTVYQAIQAMPYPMYGGITPVHTAGDVPMWFHNVDMIPEWVYGATADFERLQDEMCGALVAFAYTGNPSTDTMTWENWTPDGDGIMVWDYESGMRYHHEDAMKAAIPSTGGGFPF